MNYFEQYEKIKEMEQKAPKIKQGTIIYCQGIYSKVNEIYYQDKYVTEKDGELQLFYDVEFRDSNGILRNWKQYHDGGFVVNE